MILFKSKKKSVKVEPVIYWSNCDIPAKLFFTSMYNADYKEVGGIDNFDKIFDEYVTLSDDKTIITWFQNNKNITDLQLTINAIENHVFTLANMWMIMSDEQIKECVDTLNKYDVIRNKFDLKKNILDEILRMHKSVLGILSNQLSQLLATVDKQKEKVFYSFEDDLVSLELALGKDSIPDNISLYKFLSLTKQAVKRQEQLKKHTKNGKQ